MEFVADKNERANLLIEPTGDILSKQFRVFAVENSSDDPSASKSKQVSLWHDIPLHPESNVVNMICEVTRLTQRQSKLNKIHLLLYFRFLRFRGVQERSLKVPLRKARILSSKISKKESCENLGRLIN